MTLHAMNYTISPGDMAVRMRRLQTFTLALNEATGRILVYDDTRKINSLVGAGYATVEQAVAAFKAQDQKRNWTD